MSRLGLCFRSEPAPQGHKGGGVVTGGGGGFAVVLGDADDSLGRAQLQRFTTPSQTGAQEVRQRGSGTDMPFDADQWGSVDGASGFIEWVGGPAAEMKDRAPQLSHKVWALVSFISAFGGGGGKGIGPGYCFVWRTPPSPRGGGSGAKKQFVCLKSVSNFRPKELFPRRKIFLMCVGRGGGRPGRPGPQTPPPRPSHNGTHGPV